MSLLAQVQSFALTTLLSHHCPYCEASCASYLCSACIERLKRIDQSCSVCDLPLPSNQTLCPQCQKHTYHYDQILCAFEYSDLLSSMIYRYKSIGDLNIGKELSNQLCYKVGKHLQKSSDTPDYLVPVPMHWLAQLRRGFNQAEDIAQHLSNATGIPLLKALKKTRASSSQKTLTKSERFRKQNEKHYELSQCVHKCNIALIDDVVTSAATAQTLCKLLKSEGANRVEVWAIARTPVTK